MLSAVSLTYRGNKTSLLHFPDVVRLQHLHEIVVRFPALYLFNLLVDGSIVGRSLNITDDTEGYREAVLVAHHGEFQLQGIVLAVGIMDKNVATGDAVFADFHYFQAESFLHETD